MVTNTEYVATKSTIYKFAWNSEIFVIIYPQYQQQTLVCGLYYK
jgi:hypothetical protein